jgi:hypothetical protein
MSASSDATGWAGPVVGRQLLHHAPLGRMLAWVVLVSIAIACAFVVQDLASRAPLVTRASELPAGCRAALTAGEQVRESFLAHSCAGAFGGTPQP